MGTVTCVWESVANNDMVLPVVGFVVLFILFIVVPGKLMRNDEVKNLE